MIGAEQKTSQRIGINVTFEPHPGSALNIQDDPVSVVEGRYDGFSARGLRQLEKRASVELVQPGQLPAYIAGVHPAA
jgi:hypothetical protein